MSNKFGSLCSLVLLIVDIAAFFSSEHTRRPVVFPKVKPHAPNTKQTPAREDLSFVDRLGQMAWAIGDRLKENDCKFSIKAGMATAMLAAPAFFESTRPFFNEYKGEWALISVCRTIIYRASEQR